MPITHNEIDTRLLNKQLWRSYERLEVAQQNGSEVAIMGELAELKGYLRGSLQRGTPAQSTVDQVVALHNFWRDALEAPLKPPKL